MKKINYIYLAAISLVFFSACSPRYHGTVYAPEPIEDMKIAVLPYEVVTTGRVTEMVSEEELAEIEAHESQAFQRSMYHQLVDKLDRKYHYNNLDIQYYGETNNLLDEAEISLYESTQMKSSELCELLGVDAVIRSEVHKHVYLTDLESIGLDVAYTLIVIFGDHYPWYLPGSETGDIHISTAIISGADGSTIWAASRGTSTHWDRGTYETIERINHKISKRIPM